MREDWFQEIRKIPGWLGDLEIKNLYKFAKETPLNVALEIGSFVGKSSVSMGMAMKERNGIVICIDRATGGYEFDSTDYPQIGEGKIFIKSVTDAFLENRKRFSLDNTLIYFNIDCRVALNKLHGNFGLIFIDGNHKLDGVLYDAFWAYDHIVSNGYIVFHDYMKKPHGYDVVRTVNALKNLWEGEWMFYWGTAAFKRLDSGEKNEKEINKET